MVAGTEDRELSAFSGIGSSRDNKSMIRMIPLSIFWGVWKERNRQDLD